MHTGFDILESSGALRRHWVRRLIAGLVDMIIVFVPIWMVLSYLKVPDLTVVTSISAGVGWFLYAGFLEGRYGRTVGKLLVRHKVVSMREHRNYRQTFIRSVPKLFWFIFLPFDVFAGLATEGDPRKRWSDSVAHTLVIAYYPSVPRARKVPQARPRMQRREGKFDL